MKICLAIFFIFITYQLQVQGIAYRMTDLPHELFYRRNPFYGQRRFMQPEPPKTVLNLSRMPHITFLLGLAREILTLAGSSNTSPLDHPSPMEAQPFLDQSAASYSQPARPLPTRTFLDQPPMESTQAAQVSQSTAASGYMSQTAPPQSPATVPGAAPEVVNDPAAIKRFLF